MSKWIFSTLAFLLLTVFISALTMNVFISSVTAGFETAKESVKQKSDIFANDAVKSFYAGLTAAQKSQFEQIKAFTTEQRQQVLSGQCKTTELKDAPFCNPQFIAGQITFDDAVKESYKKQFEAAQNLALEQMRAQLSSYAQYPLLLIAIVSGIVSLVLYVIRNGIASGVQVFAGSVSWLSFLSAVSFKLMPALIDKLLSRVSAVGEVNKLAVSLTKEVVFSWLNPAMQSGFMVSILMAGIGFVIWSGVKIFRKYELVI